MYVFFQNYFSTLKKKEKEDSISCSLPPLEEGKPKSRKATQAVKIGTLFTTKKARFNI